MSFQSETAQFYGGPRDGDIVEIRRRNGLPPAGVPTPGAKYVATPYQTSNRLPFYAYPGTEGSLKLQRHSK